MLQIKVERESYVTGFYAFDERIGLDYELIGEDWVSCGSKIGTGSTIQEAIDDLLDILGVTNYTWS